MHQVRMNDTGRVVEVSEAVARELLDTGRAVPVLCDVRRAVARAYEVRG